MSSFCVQSYCSLDKSVNYGVSEEADSIMDQLREIADSYHLSASWQDESDSHKFYRLASHWKRDTRFVSSITDMAMQSTYQQIIGMGKRALPFLFRELSARPNYYFWALEAITGIDPVPASERGLFDEMVNAWLLWGSENGYID